MIGSAALFGFVLIYFHEVRGIPLGRAGLRRRGDELHDGAAARPSPAPSSDRFGARRMLTAGCLVSIVAGSLYAFVASFPAAVGRLGAARRRQRAVVPVAVGAAGADRHSRTSDRPCRPSPAPSLNLGAALGGVLGGFLVHANIARRVPLAVRRQRATYVVFLAVLPGMPTGQRRRTCSPRPRAARLPPPCSATSSSSACSSPTSPIGARLRLPVRVHARVRVDARASARRTIGVLFMFGAASVVLTQIPTLRWVRGRHRMRSLALMNLWFVAAFALMVTTPHVADRRGDRRRSASPRCSAASARPCSARCASR